MSKAWVCPSCGRGVRADVETCDHGGSSLASPTGRYGVGGTKFQCAACDNGRQACGCYMPERHGFIGGRLA